MRGGRGGWLREVRNMSAVLWLFLMDGFPNGDNFDAWWWQCPKIFKYFDFVVKIYLFWALLHGKKRTETTDAMPVSKRFSVRMSFINDNSRVRKDFKTSRDHFHFPHCTSGAWRWQGDKLPKIASKFATTKTWKMRRRRRFLKQENGDEIPPPEKYKWV